MKYILYITLLLLLSSCAKDKLFGDKAVLIGTWNWTETKHTYGICEGYTSSATLTPETEGISYTMEFYEKGIVKFYQDETYLDKARIVFTGFGGKCTGSFSDYIRFEISLNNSSKDISTYFSGCVSESEMQVTSGFPYEVYEKGCEFYSSHFIKQ